MWCNCGAMECRLDHSSSRTRPDRPILISVTRFTSRIILLGPSGSLGHLKMASELDFCGARWNRTIDLSIISADQANFGRLRAGVLSQVRGGVRP